LKTQLKKFQLQVITERKNTENLQTLIDQLDVKYTRRYDNINENYKLSLLSLDREIARLEANLDIKKH